MIKRITPQEEIKEVEQKMKELEIRLDKAKAKGDHLEYSYILEVYMEWQETYIQLDKEIKTGRL